MSYKKKLLLLLVITIIVTLLFIAWGVSESNAEYFLPRRIRKIVAILITAYSIGYSSVMFQTITNNKILTPTVMGLDSLYMFIQTVIVFFFGSKELIMMTGISNFFLSIGFMIVASVGLYFILFGKEGRSLYFVILAGMIMGGLFNGMATFMQVLLDPNEFLVLQGKMFASFNNVNEELIVISLIIVFVTILITIKDYPKLDVISLGVDVAINLGVPYSKIVFKNLILISILISVSTALTGPITFLGIIVASLSREMIGTYKHSWRVVCSIIIGWFMLVVGQTLVERVFSFDTTISVIINFIGGVYFIYLMKKEAAN